MKEYLSVQPLQYKQASAQVTSGKQRNYRQTRLDGLRLNRACTRN